MAVTVRCASIGCWSMHCVLVGQVPLCEAHRAELVRSLTLAVPGVAIVYYVTWADTDCVKIGTTTSITKRLRSLSRPPHRMARLVRWEPGGYDLERRRHTQWAHLRKPTCVHGSECFRYTDALGDHMRHLQKP